MIKYTLAQHIEIMNIFGYTQAVCNPVHLNSEGISPLLSLQYRITQSIGSTIYHDFPKYAHQRDYCNHGGGDKSFSSSGTLTKTYMLPKEHSKGIELLDRLEELLGVSKELEKYRKYFSKYDRKVYRRMVLEPMDYEKGLHEPDGYGLGLKDLAERNGVYS